ncbi:MAG: Crp/Fnr family transcriptional regulator [Novosphingobium sp.]
MIGEALLHHLTTFGTLGPDDAAAVLAIDGEVRSYGRDCDIIRSGDRPTYSVLALDGLLIRYSPRADGGRQVYGMYFPTDAPCLETLHTDIMDHNLTPAVETRVALIPHAVLYETMDRFPRVLSLIWRQTLVQASMFRAWLMRNSSQPAHAAMAHLFCECLRRTQAAGLARGNVCDLPVTQEVLADALGISLVHVNRTLQILRQTGAVSFRSGVLEVHDPAQLAGIADFDPHYLHLHR